MSENVNSTIGFALSGYILNYFSKNKIFIILINKVFLNYYYYQYYYLATRMIFPNQRF